MNHACSSPRWIEENKACVCSAWSNSDHARHGRNSTVKRKGSSINASEAFYRTVDLVKCLFDNSLYSAAVTMVSNSAAFAAKCHANTFRPMSHHLNDDARD